MKKKNVLKIIFLAVLVVGTVLIIMQQRNTPYQHDTGFVFGTEYHITYQSSDDLQPEIDKIGADEIFETRFSESFCPKSTCVRQ